MHINKKHRLEEGRHRDHKLNSPIIRCPFYRPVFLSETQIYCHLSYNYFPTDEGIIQYEKRGGG